MNIKRALTIIVVTVVLLLAMSGCASPDSASVASRNLSTAADQFEVNRRVIFYNVIHDTYILTVEGRCSINVDSGDDQLECTCMSAPGQFKKHYLGRADNVTYFVEQLDPMPVDEYHYRVVFRPETILPDMELDLSP